MGFKGEKKILGTDFSCVLFVWRFFSVFMWICYLFLALMLHVFLPPCLLPLSSCQHVGVYIPLPSFFSVIMVWRRGGSISRVMVTQCEQC